MKVAVQWINGLGGLSTYIADDHIEAAFFESSLRANGYQDTWLCPESEMLPAELAEFGIDQLVAA